MNRLHVYISFNIGIKSIGSGSQQQRYTITIIYCTTHESIPMHLDKAPYILPSEAAAVCTQEGGKRIRIYYIKREEHEYDYV